MLCLLYTNCKQKGKKSKQFDLCTETAYKGKLEATNVFEK